MVSFTDETIRSYPPFYELEQPVRERFIELLKTTEINDKGTFKRKSNGFLLFRKHCAELIKQQGQSGETQRTGMTQADFSKYVQEKWKDLTPAGREAWNKAHDAEVQEQLKLFPEYTYKPMPGPIWDSLYAEGKKRFWLDSVAAICRKLLDPSSAWKHLTVADWMRKNPANESLVDLEKYAQATASHKPKVRHASRGSESSDGSASSKSGSRPRDTCHPYNNARSNVSRQGSSSRDRIQSELKRLMTMLLPLGPQPLESPVRRLVLACFQPEEFTKRVYVEEEIPRDTPEEVIDMLMEGQDDIRDATDVIIIEGYTNLDIDSSGNSLNLPNFRDFAAVADVCRTLMNTPSPTTPTDTQSPSPEDVVNSCKLPPFTPVTNNHPALPAAQAWPAPQVSVVQSQPVYHPQAIAPVPELGSSLDAAQFQTSYNQTIHEAAQYTGSTDLPSTSQHGYLMDSNAVQLAYPVPQMSPMNTGTWFVNAEDPAAVNQYITPEYLRIAQGEGPSQQQDFYYQDNSNNAYGNNAALALHGPMSHDQQSSQLAYESNFMTQVLAQNTNAPNSQTGDAAAELAYFDINGHFALQD